MTTIKNYDSRLSLSNYKIGDIYTFYIHNFNLKNLPKIRENHFEPYIQSLTDVVDNNQSYFNFTKSIGVVVDTHASTHPNDIDCITVMFKTTSNEYVVNKYVVNHTKTYL